MKEINNIKLDELVDSLSINEKIALVSGHNFMYTNEIDRVGISALRFSDGPHGLRVQEGNGDNGVSASKPATSFPTAATSSNSFNPKLLNKMGEAIGEECNFYNVDILLGPGVNIKRNPLCGRNFEYFSEDPFLTAELATKEVLGLKNKNVGCSLKHFACNNSENYRFMSNSIIDERALREIYLYQFEKIVKEAKPETLMCAYNQIDGTYCSENKYLLKDILRDEWGFDGLVMTDWGATHDRVKGIKSGLDLEMPGDTLICRKSLKEAIDNGTLKIEDLNISVRNILKSVLLHNEKDIETCDFLKHHELAKEIALESAVLLKNNKVLPLNHDEKVLVVGELFEKMRYQGSGSSMINPYYYVSPKNAFIDNGVNYDYLKGYKESELEPNRELIDEVIQYDKHYDKIILFLGLTDYVESEGGDRINLSLPNNQLKLVEELIKLNKKIIVVLFGGGVIELPFFDKVDAVLNMFLPGQNGGTATYELLYGLRNPSGKLAETWPLKYQDVPFYKEYSNTKYELYKESIYVGYRYYLTKNIPTRFEFGYGLSYSNFTYSNLRLEEKEKEILIKVDVTNDSEIKGKEVVQIYVSSPRDKIYRPIRELKAFKKDEILPHETKTFDLVIKKDDLRFFDVFKHKFLLEDGVYDFEVAKSSKNIILNKSLHIKGEQVETLISKELNEIYLNLDFDKLTDQQFEELIGYKIPPLPKTLPIHLDSRFDELQKTFFGKILFNAVLSVANKDFKKAKKLPEGNEKENRIKGALFLKRILETNSIRTMSMSASSNFPFNFAQGFVELSNGHIFKCTKHFLKNIKTIKLPCEEGTKDESK